MIKKLKKGKYKATVKCSNMIEAVTNGLLQVYPETEMIFDGQWCKFYKGEKEVWDCNPQFAQYNFTLSAHETEVKKLNKSDVLSSKTMTTVGVDGKEIIIQPVIVNK